MVIHLTGRYYNKIGNNRPENGNSAANTHFRWADKSLSVIMFENGQGGVNSDHTPFDAMVNVVMSHFIGN